MTGADLRKHRNAAGLTQTQLADLAGCRRGAVAYWERKDVLGPPFGLVARLARLVGMYDYASSTRSGGRACAGWGVTPDAAPLTPPEDAAWSAKLATLEVQTLAREARRHARDVGRQAAWQARLQVQEHTEQPVQHRAERRAQHAPQDLTRCGALTRKGTACRHAVEPGRTRCKFHGGRSTGQRTPEGRARIAKAQRRRWTAWRVAQAGPPDEPLGR